jgi:hypothetical protein
MNRSRPQRDQSSFAPPVRSRRTVSSGEDEKGKGRAAMPPSPMVIGGRDFTLSELFAWHPAHLAGLIVKYQEMRQTWRSADEAVVRQVAALERELKSLKRELAGARAELQHQSKAAKGQEFVKTGHRAA